MGILRTVAIAAAATTTAFSLSSKTHPTTLASLSSNLVPGHDRSGLSRSFSPPPSAVKMETFHHKFASQNASLMPELLTEYMVDMKCEGCVNSVKNKLQTIEGVKNVEVDLGNQVVRILGISPVKAMTEALEQTGRKARLIGQGVPEDFLVSAAVAEFKGPEIFGVARLAQVNMELARVEASFSGLPPGKHSWSINEYGDLTRGPESTGNVFNPITDLTDKKPLGDLGTLYADEKGEAFYSSVKENLRVADLIGRSIVLYRSDDKSDKGLAAAVVARSAGVGENYKSLCTCDGTTIWETTNNDFVTSKV